MVAALALVALSACELVSGENYRLSVSPGSAQVLNHVSARLQAAGAELEFRCGSTGSCGVVIDGSREPKLDAEVINHPFEPGKKLALRIHGGTEALQASLYGTLGEYAPTSDFQGRLDERVLKLEGGQLKFRCVATREASPRHECWVIVAAELLK